MSGNAGGAREAAACRAAADITLRWIPSFIDLFWRKSRQRCTVGGGWARTAYEEIEPVCGCLAWPSIKLGWAALWTTTLGAMP
jgi:hypothetical protein